MRSINKQNEINNDKGKVKVEFTGKNITPYGGVGLFRKFIQKLGIEKVLDKVPNTGGEEGKYSMGKKVMSLVYGLVCGLERPSDTRGLKHDTVFKTIVGYEDYPDQSTFSRFLKTFL